MALNAYLRLTGDVQGEIKGSVTQAGREDSIMVMACSHEINSPRDAASGLATGKRQHKPLVITKEIDKSTPLLMNALVNNENISNLSLQFWQPSRSGKEVQYYTIELINATVSDIRQEMLDNRYPENMRLSVTEHVSFNYQKIIKTWIDGGISAEDDWGADSVVASVRTNPVRRRVRK
jgi:type VI secretion system secreted protein Hcp